MIGVDVPVSGMSVSSGEKVGPCEPDEGAWFVEDAWTKETA
jgi:hypothetical protein